jgi:LuxR family maltose regulon positive regulatory protein
MTKIGIPDSVLTTKLYRPSPTPHLVTRPRLTERLDDSLRQGHHLILVVAPAGYGKTTLVTDWLSKADILSAWVSLDEGDNDPVRFFTYVVAALQTVDANVGQSLLDTLRTTAQSPEAFVDPLINDLAAANRPIILALDDYHVITTLLIQEAMVYLLDYAPPNLHLLVQTRVDPPFRLARLRVGGVMTEIRDRDLRFTPEEMTAFLNSVHRLNLPVEQIAALESRTEGWPAGIQLAALSLQGLSPERATQFIQAFSGSHHYVIDYLADEVLRRQSEEVQSFLLQTCILKRLSAPLCDAVTGQQGSQALLELLERSNLFLVRLDDRRQWYRYHPLFAGLLRARLAEAHRDQVPVLHQRASLWYERNELGPEAVVHALAAGDLERITRLIEGRALAMMDASEWSTLAEWLDALPADVVRRQPWLCIARAWILAGSDQFDAAARYLDEAEVGQKGMAESVADTAESQRLAGYAATLRTHMTSLQGDVEATARFARQALDLLPQRDQATRSLVAKHLVVLLRVRGDLRAADQVLAEALADSRAARDRFATVFLLGQLGLNQIMKGQLRLAYATCQEALRIAEEHLQQVGRQLPAVTYVYPALSSLLREWNDLQGAVHYARAGIEFSQQWRHAEELEEDRTALAVALHALGGAEDLEDNRIALALALLPLGDEDGALRAVGAAKEDRPGLSSWYVELIEQCEVRIQLALGNQGAVERWVGEMGLRADAGPNPGSMRAYGLLARMLMMQRRWAEALLLLDRLLPLQEATGAGRFIVEALVLKSVVLQALEEKDQALSTLGQALALAEPEGYMRTFVDQGDVMRDLLRLALAQGVAPAYTAKLLAAFLGPAVSLQPSVRPATAGLVEPLSEQELRVLQLVASGMSNRETAQELYVTVGTVKKHLNNIFGKLGVSSRTQAVARARELNLLS